MSLMLYSTQCTHVLLVTYCSIICSSFWSKRCTHWIRSFTVFLVLL